MVGTWMRLASVELGSNGTLDTGSFTAKKYLWVKIMVKKTSATSTHGIIFNDDTGSNYSRRRSQDGGSDQTRTSQSAIYGALDNTNWNSIKMFIINKSDKEKLIIYEDTGITATGAGNAPGRTEMAAKWTNTSAQISSIKVVNHDGTAYTADSGSSIQVWGFD